MAHQAGIASTAGNCDRFEINYVDNGGSITASTATSKPVATRILTDERAGGRLSGTVALNGQVDRPNYYAARGAKHRDKLSHINHSSIRLTTAAMMVMMMTIMMAEMTLLKINHKFANQIRIPSAKRCERRSY